jgi:hypothetical protein
MDSVHEPVDFIHSPRFDYSLLLLLLKKTRYVCRYR